MAARGDEDRLERKAGILSSEDPPAVEVVRGGGESEFVLTCEHAGRLLPKRLGTLGLSAVDLGRHIAWDIGVAEVSRRLSQLLDAPLVLQHYSRLVVDCNRSTSAADYIVRVSEATEIPGNQNLSAAEIEARTAEIHRPYHQAIRELLDARDAAGRTSVLVAMHSFTPVFHGQARPWQVGVLHEHDKAFGEALLASLARRHPHLTVGDNQPYRLSEHCDYSTAEHGYRRGLRHVELEIRQDLIDAAPGQAQWADLLADLLPEAWRLAEARGPFRPPA